MIVDYTIVSGETVEELLDQVRALLPKWEPFETPFFGTFDGTKRICQAMIKRLRTTEETLP